MKKFSIKIIMALFAFSLGIGGVWMSGAFPFLASLFERDALVSEKLRQTIRPSALVDSEKIEIRFKRIYDDEGSGVADFEVINGTWEPIRYMGWNKNRYCEISFKSGEKLYTANECGCVAGYELQTLEAGETALFTVSEAYLRRRFKIKAQTIKADFGFEVMVGADKRKKMLWTEEVTFKE